MKNILAKGFQQTTMNDIPSPGMGFSSTGYVTEKLYMLLQLYLQNKGWNPSVELLQCFSELKETSMLPSTAYLQMMASRVTLDSQGRLILRGNGKIILPFEHFANAVMLKHMNGPHGLHLGIEATVRAVMESYTIGRENFGMEKEFIVEVVQNCPNPACRYYKSQMELTQKTLQHLGNPNYIVDQTASNSDVRNRLSGIEMGNPNNTEVKQNPPILERPKSVVSSAQQITSALIHQQNRVLAKQSFEKMNINLEKQRQQLQAQQHLDLSKSHKTSSQFEPPATDHKVSDFLRTNIDSFEGVSAANKDLLALHNGAWASVTTPQTKDDIRNSEGGQEKIIQAFSEVMKNMARMKSYVRPAMCKPYGKQSEALQKTLVDTIQLIQSLRSFLPPSHIQVSSWKNEDKHHFEDT
ncbi:hypothetical protein WA026_020159 [Henosepilachna vigintioctopunctata]|uniref:Genetic suppressor element-like domain-containing protein n=1 Tax=Henosepilachna vigintioctopunctata TaxID=420089 RepID=A0AAW1UCR8_9CUCU